MHRPWQRIRPGAGDPINTLGKRQISVTRAKSASGSSKAAVALDLTGLAKGAHINQRGSAAAGFAVIQPWG